MYDKETHVMCSAMKTS